MTLSAAMCVKTETDSLASQTCLPTKHSAVSEMELSAPHRCIVHIVYTDHYRDTSNMKTYHMAYGRVLRGS